ncbi:MAG: FkbM family methyltransferase, partial [Pseudomonadota bacterium]
RVPDPVPDVHGYPYPRAGNQEHSPSTEVYFSTLKKFKICLDRGVHLSANVGVFAMAAASIAAAGTVLAVEADIWLAQILRRSAKLKANRSLNIRVLPAAISSHNGVATLLIAKRGRASNALEKAGGHSQMGGIRETELVPTLKLDRLLEYFPEPHLVKIDVEGAELMALQGATRLVSEVRPVFYIEVGDNVATKVMKLFREREYGAYDGVTGHPVDHPTYNTFFVPNENETAIQLVKGML